MQIEITENSLQEIVAKIMASASTEAPIPIEERVDAGTTPPYPKVQAGTEGTENGDPFPTDKLPAPLRELVEKVSEAHDTPNSLAAACALAVVSAAVGQALRLESGNCQTVGANLFVLGIARSGTGKSVVFKAISDPLLNFDGDQTHQSEAVRRAQNKVRSIIAKSELKKLNADLKAAETDEQRKAVEERLQQHFADQEAQECSIVPATLVVDNVTSEGLVHALARNNGTLASFSADARDLIGIVSGKYGAGGESPYLKGYPERTGPGHESQCQPQRTHPCVQVGVRFTALDGPRGLFVVGGIHVSPATRHCCNRCGV